MWSTQNGRGVKFKVCTMLKIVPRNLFFSGCSVVMCFVSPVCVQNSDALVTCRCRSQNILFFCWGSVHTESRGNEIQQFSTARFESTPVSDVIPGVLPLTADIQPMRDITVCISRVLRGQMLHVKVSSVFYFYTCIHR